MTQPVPDGPSRSTGILITIFTVVVPIAVAIAWWVQWEANFNHTFEELPLKGYIPIVIVSTVIGLGIPLVVVVYSLIVIARNPGRRMPIRGVVSGGIGLLVALPMLFDAVPLISYDLGHAPNAEESSVSSATLLTKAKAFENETAAQVGEQIIRRDRASPFVCKLSNGDSGRGYSVAVWMTAPPTQAAISGILSYWKAQGYALKRVGMRYSASPIHQLAPALVLTPEVFEVTVTTSCVVH